MHAADGMRDVMLVLAWRGGARHSFAEGGTVARSRGGGVGVLYGELRARCGAGLDVLEELLNALGHRARVAIVAEGGLAPLVSWDFRGLG